MKNLLLVLALALGLSTGATDARAQMTCDSRDALVTQLREKYGEVRRGSGLAGRTAIFEIWASEATGTWTILRTTVNGLACVVAVGDGWQDDNPPPAGSPI